MSTYSEIRRNWSLLLIPAATWIAGCSSPKEPASSMLPMQEACRYLWDQQSADGGWHSRTHGILKGGESFTAYILYTLLNAPDSLYTPTEEQKEKGLQFIRTHINDAGVLGRSDPDILDYPVYATSYGLRVLLKHGHAGDSVPIQKMAAYLQSRQFTEQRGIAKDHPAYGSWGFGEENIPLGETGHIDLSHTRRVLEALREYPATNPKVFLACRSFLERLQKYDQPGFDGGFYSSTVSLGSNKGDTNEKSRQSYATATCDGMLALLASGLPKEDPRVSSAFGWLLRHQRLEYPEGIPLDHPFQWHLALFFYHLAGRAEAYRAMKHPGAWKGELLELISSRQAPDGSFSNPMGGPNKEDDPLLATALALQAMIYAWEKS